MWGRDKNFQFSMMYEQRNRKNKISLGEVLFDSPFTAADTDKPSPHGTLKLPMVHCYGRDNAEDVSEANKNILYFPPFQTILRLLYVVYKFEAPTPILLCPYPFFIPSSLSESRANSEERL